MDVEALIAKARRQAAAGPFPQPCANGESAAGETLPPPDKPDFPDFLPPNPQIVGFVGFVDGLEAHAAGPKPVRCVACRHIEPNTHTPALGWCGCRAGRHREHGWPSAPRICGAFEEGPPGLN
jgi:hypothetical protein